MRHLIVLPALLAMIVFSGCCSSNSCNQCCNSHYQNNQQPGQPNVGQNAASPELAQPEPIAPPDEDSGGYAENLRPAILPPVEPPMPSLETKVQSKPAPTNLVPPTNEIPTNSLPVNDLPENELPTVLDSI